MTTLLNSGFLKITNAEIQDNKIIFEVSLNANHSIYQGHFPNRPIVPGVCTLQMVRELLEVHLNKKLTFITSKNVKFNGMIDPNITPNITFEILILPTELDQQVNVKVKVFYQEVVFCKYDGTYKNS
jgi:3-hydroxyacyl-[acyl-carrier-protein] dehydratase